MLFRSNERIGGASWSPILSFEGGGLKLEDTLVEIAGLALDPSDPMRIWIGLNRSTVRATPRAFAGEVVTSKDGGATWAAVTGETLPRLSDLVLGLDGRYLFAATESGVWRMPLR